MQHIKITILALTLFCLTLLSKSQGQFQVGTIEYLGYNRTITDAVFSPAQNTIVVGKFYDSLDLDPSGLTFLVGGATSLVHNAFVGIYDYTGAFISGFSLGNATDSVTIKDVILDPYENIIICGSYKGTVDFAYGGGSTLTSTGPGVSGFIARYSSTGVYLSAASINTTGTEAVVTGLTTDGFGNNIYAVGYFNDTVDVDPGAGVVNYVSPVGYKGFYAKFDLSFYLSDSRFIDGSGNVVPSHIAMNSTDNIAIAGYYDADVDVDLTAGINLLNSNGGKDVFYAYYDPAMGLANSVGFGGTGSDILKDIATSAGSVLIMIEYNNTINLDPLGAGFNLTSNGGTDVAVARYIDLSASSLVFGMNFGNAGPNTGFKVINSYATGGFRPVAVELDFEVVLSYSGALDTDPTAAVSTINSTNTPINTAIVDFDKSGNYVYAGSVEASSVVGISSGSVGGNYIIITGNFSGTNVELLPYNDSFTSTNPINTGFISAYDRCHMSSLGTFLVGDYECGTCNASMTVSVKDGAQPYSYFWGNGDYNSYDKIATGACADTIKYDVTITDVRSCQVNDSIYIYPHPSTAPLTQTLNVLPTSCGNNYGSATVSSVSNSYGTVEYYFSNGDTTNVADSLLAGDYFIHVSDSLGCYVNENFSIINIDGPSVTLVSATNPNCGGDNTGNVDINVTGGTAPYTFAWSNGATTEDLTNVGSASYTVVVTDATGCSNTLCTYLSQPEPLSVYMNTSTYSNCYTNNGALEVITYGGYAPYTYQWDASTGFQTGDSVINLFAGVHYVIVTDSLGCDTTVAIGSSDDFGPWVSLIGNANSTCTSGGGYIDVDMFGTPGYTYLWSNGMTSEDIYGLSAGSYYLEVTDGVGCKTTWGISIFQNLPVNPTVCMVTVDSSETQNVVVWDKSLNPEAAYFNIYREGACDANYFGLVGVTDYDSLSVFYDTVVNSDTRSWKYYVTTVDTCGFESTPSIINKTIHLSMFIDANIDAYLTWEAYEGRPIQRYEIYREQAALNGIFDFVDSVPPSTFNYLDTINFSGYTQVEYFVDAIPTTPCFASKSFNLTDTRSHSAFNQNSSRSNHTRSSIPMDTTILTATMNKEIVNDLINVYPNPANDKLTIKIKGEFKTYSISIFDQLGKQVRSFESTGNTMVSTRELNEGIYFLRIGNPVGQVKVFKLVISR